MLIIYLFSLRAGVLIKALSHIWGRLNLPILLLRVGLLTLIKMDSLIYLDKSVLAKGPNFVVTPKHPPNLEYITAIEAACTKLSQQDVEEIRANINWVLRASHPPKPNLTKTQNLAIRELKKDRDCIVFTADKGIAMAIMDRQDYISKANNICSQNTYKSIKQDPTNTIKNKLITILKRVKSQTGLSNQTYKVMYPMGCVPPSSMVYQRSISQIPH